MLKTIQVTIVLVAGAWALLAAMMTQAKDTAVANLRTWLPDPIVDLLAAMPEPVIAHRNVVYAGLAMLALGLVLGPPAYRVAIDRDKRLSISSRVRQVVSRVKNGGLNTFESVLLAVLLSSTLYIAQSWAMVSIVGGVLIFYVFSQRPTLVEQAVPAEPAPSAPVAPTAVNLEADRDMRRLMDLAIYHSAVSMLDGLLRLAPVAEMTDGPLQKGANYLEENDAALQFIHVIRDRMDPGTERRANFERVMNHASAMAEQDLEHTPVNLRPDIDHLLLRKWMIAHYQCVHATGWLTLQSSILNFPNMTRAPGNGTNRK